MPLRLVRRKQKDSDDDSSSGFNEEFKSKLNLLLKTPQGREINNRSWRVSDKFMGGQPIDTYREERNRRKHKADKSDIFERFSKMDKKSASSSKSHSSRERKNRKRSGRKKTSQKV